MNPTKQRYDMARIQSVLDNRTIWLVAIIGVSLSLIALLFIQKQLDAHKLLDFEWVAHNRVRALNHGLDNSMLAVVSLRDHVKVSGSLDAQEFRSFASSLMARDAGVQALMWVTHVGDADNPAFEPSVGAEREGEFDSIYAGQRANHFAVLHTVEVQDSPLVAGLDLASIPAFSEVLSRAREQEGIAMSGRIAFSSARENDDYGFLLVSPVFDVTHDSRSGEPSGFVVGAFRLDSLVNAAISLLEPRGVDVLVLDKSAPADERFLHFYASRLSPIVVGPDDFETWWKDETQARIAEHVQLADRQLTIVCGRSNLFRSAEAFTEGPWIVFVAGLSFTLLLSLYLARISENMRQRSAMERQLIGREELFRQMTETVDEAFWAASPDGVNLLYLSPAYAKIVGVDDDNGLPQSLWDSAPSEDRQILSDALCQIGMEGGDTEVVHRIKRADGMLRWARTRGFAVRNEADQIYRLVGFTEDITERKLADEALRDSEAQLRDLFQQSPDIIMTVDAQGTVLLMNRSTPEMPADRAVGRNSLALMPRDFRKWFKKALNKVFTKAKTQQFRYSADDGKYWEGRIVPISGDDGRVSAAIVIAGDVTERRSLEAQALRNARLASIGVLAAGVAHEINNPNNAINFNASLVKRAWQDITPILKRYFEDNGDFVIGGLSFAETHDDFPRLLGEISRNSDRIRRIVQNLKHMSRQDSNEINGDVDLQQVLEETIMILHNQIQKYTDAFTLDIPDGLPAVRGNSQQLEQVFINILLNALQAITDRARGVHVSAGFDEQDGVLWVCVRDEGEGIPERELGRLTEPFFTTRAATGGTGLGLSISRSIIERHEGKLSFRSAPGSGTTVTIRIPVNNSVRG